MRCGNRIGFGSTDPKQITTWYEISAMASDTGITLATSAGTIAAGTPYVIEDLRAYLNCTSVTTSLGGIYVIKGLNPAHFTGAGGAVPAATTVDNIKASYFLKDAATGTALVGGETAEHPGLLGPDDYDVADLAHQVVGFEGGESSSCSTPKETYSEFKKFNQRLGS